MITEDLKVYFNYALIKQDISNQLLNPGNWTSHRSLFQQSLPDNWTFQTNLFRYRCPFGDLVLTHCGRCVPFISHSRVLTGGGWVEWMACSLERGGDVSVWGGQGWAVLAEGVEGRSLAGQQHKVHAGLGAAELVEFPGRAPIRTRNGLLGMFS